ncbi:MAG: hypothetical protein J6S71_02785 [Clostridia bacterium]|nr:hypothetical protein [Clostridia bacterium]
MKGYKGFSKDLICRGKQYAENTVFEEDNAVICNSGMHFCENPFDVLDHYGFVNDNAELNEFAEVEALDKVFTDDNKKYCTKKLKVGAKLSISGFVKAFVEFTLSKVDKVSAATNTGDRSAATNTGNRSAATNTGDRSAATNTGDRSAATNTGDYSAATNTGNRSAATNTGDYSAATNTGDYSAATVEGKDSVAIACGYQSKAKACIGSAIVVAERGDWNGTTYPLISIKAAIVDGEKIKADTYYTLVNGEFEEAKEQ